MEPETHQRSHHIFTKAGRQECISVPVHGNQPLKVGLLRALLKLTSIDEREF